MADDDMTTISLDNNCWPSIVMFGTTGTKIHVGSNGNVQFGDDPLSFQPPNVACCTDPLSVLTGLPVVGVWCDFNITEPTVNGQILITATATEVKINYNNIAYFGPEIGPAGTITSTFEIRFLQSASGFVDTVELGNLQGVGPDPDTGQSEDNWMGIARGTTPPGTAIPGATDPGPAN